MCSVPQNYMPKNGENGKFYQRVCFTTIKPFLKCAWTVGEMSVPLRVSSPPRRPGWWGVSSSFPQEPSPASALGAGSGCCHGNHSTGREGLQKSPESLGAWNFPGSKMAINEAIKIWVFVPSKTTVPSSSLGSGHSARQGPDPVQACVPLAGRGGGGNLLFAICIRSLRNRFSF